VIPDQVLSYVKLMITIFGCSFSFLYIPLCFSISRTAEIHKHNITVAYPGILLGGGESTNSVEDRENGDLGAVAPLVRGSGDSCNLVQVISFYIAKFS
jgi:hypothetical protein